MKNLVLGVIIALAFSQGVYAQNVGVNETGAAPHSAAIFDVYSSTKGVLFPRLTTLARDTMNPAPIAGMLIYCVEDSCYQFFNGALWVSFCTGQPIYPSFSVCGSSFTDVRDNTVYGSVLIGSQCWMKENLRYDTTGSWHYNNSSAFAVYGRLYDWNTAMSGVASSGSNPSGVRGVCPQGWHLPSDTEWQQLVTTIGGSANGGDLKSIATASGIGSWANPNVGATDLYGFTALPGGSGPPFVNAQNVGSFWSSTEASGVDAYYRILDASNASILSATHYKVRGLSVRCIKD